MGEEKKNIFQPEFPTCIFLFRTKIYSAQSFLSLEAEEKKNVPGKFMLIDFWVQLST